MKKILIHALGAEMGGAMRHLTNFLPELGKQDSLNQYVVLTRATFPEIEVGNNVTIVRVQNKITGSWLGRLYYDNIVVPQLIKRKGFDLLVTLTNFGPIKAPCPQILFQRNPIYFCHYYLERIAGKDKLETTLRRKLAVEAMKRANMIVTPSNAMADMIRGTCPQVAGRYFRTLYHAYSQADLNGEPLESKLIDLLNRPGVKFLYPTHPAPHKGFEVLFEALADVKQSTDEFTLFLTTSQEVWPKVVKGYERLIQELGIGRHVVFLGPILQGQMGALYKLCDLMVYPSLCESFGFSMLEAMNADLPIVAAATAVNKEICDKAAVYYPPLNSKQLAEILIRFCSRQIHQEAATTRMRDAFDWSWERYVREFLSIMDKYATV